MKKTHSKKRKTKDVQHFIKTYLCEAKISTEKISSVTFLISTFVFSASPLSQSATMPPAVTTSGVFNVGIC